MPTTRVSNRTTPARHRGRSKHATLRRAADTSNPQDSAAHEIQQLRDQIMHLRATVTEQEASIDFLRDLLSQRWFDGD